MRKNLKVLLIAGTVMALAAGCGAKEETNGVQETTIAAEQTEAEETTKAAEETEKVSEAEETTEAVKEETEKAPEAEKKESEVQASHAADDNFAVDPADAEAFGRSVKEAVAAKDLEKLADLTAYPVYIGFADGGVSVENKEEMFALGEEKIFTQEWMDAIAQADETALSPSMAGFVLTGGDSGANIVFGLRDGKLAVSGINY